MARKTTLPWKPIRDLMLDVGASIVARDAVDLVLKVTEERIKALTSDALKLARHSKRTKITRDDVSMVLSMK